MLKPRTSASLFFLLFVLAACQREYAQESELVGRWIGSDSSTIWCMDLMQDGYARVKSTANLSPEEMRISGLTQEVQYAIGYWSLEDGVTFSLLLQRTSGDDAPLPTDKSTLLGNTVVYELLEAPSETMRYRSKTYKVEYESSRSETCPEPLQNKR